MQFSTLLAAVTVALSGVSASPTLFSWGSLDLKGLLGGCDVSFGNKYNAPTPPWNQGLPGWYYGLNPQQNSGLFCLSGPVCQLLNIFPGNILKCPGQGGNFNPPPNPPLTTAVITVTKTISNSATVTQTATVTQSAGSGSGQSCSGYNQVFSNLTAAIQANDYLTFGLVDNVLGCAAMCNTVQNCNFFNTYYDVNGKSGSTQLSCALFSLCHTSQDAINKGGQWQPSGGVNSIASSNGYCKQ